VAEPVRLQLLLGPGIPLPAPREVIDAVQELKVESGSGGTQSGFELTFRLSNRSPLHTLFLLTGGAMPPIFRVVIAVTHRAHSCQQLAIEWGVVTFTLNFIPFIGPFIATTLMTLFAFVQTESGQVAVTVPNDDPTARGVAWITVAQDDRAWTELGIPALQVATGD